MKRLFFSCCLLLAISARADLASDFINMSSESLVERMLVGLKEHLEKRIQDAQVIETPFPYLVVDDLLPDDFYEAALRLWPNNEDFVGRSYMGRMPTNYGCLEQTALNKNQKIFWRTFGEVIVNRFIKPAVVEKLKPYFKYKYGMSNYPIESLNMGDFINLRQDSLLDCYYTYANHPHVDQLNIFTAVLIYFASDDEHPDLGTTLFSLEPAGDPNGGNYGGYPKSIGKIPYKRNRMHCMFQSPTSWHGTDPSPYDTAYLRRIFFAPIFLSPEFMEAHYKGVYRRTYADDYYFDHRFLHKGNWIGIWDHSDTYK